MKIIICGMSGFVGQALYKNFLLDEHEVLGLSIRDETSTSDIVEVLEKSDVLINLSGTTIIGRWNDAYKEGIYKSRIGTTKKLVDAIALCKTAPKTFLSTSAVGIYRSNRRHTEASTDYGDDFLAEVCQAWEAEAFKATANDVRVAVLRFGMVLGKEGGAMKKMMLPFKLGLGGRLGSGKQSVSWIHLDDLVSMFKYLILHEQEGIFNATAPDVVINSVQTKVLADTLHRSAIFTIPVWFIKIIYGEGSTVLLDSKDAYPVRWQESDFKYSYPTLIKAFKEICS